MMLINLSIFSIRCTKIIIKPVQIDLPEKPVLKRIIFKNFQGRVIIENPMALAENQIMMNSYIEQLIKRIEINNEKAERQ